MSAHVVIKDTMRVLDIDGNNYDIDPIFTDSVISHVNILIEKGISSGEKVGILRQIISYMYTHFVAWDESSQPDQTGVHPGNRSTFGVGGTDSQHLGFNILSVGFAWEECKDATAIQAPPAPLNKEAKDYNDMLVEVSDGLIPPLRLIRCLTIAGGHTNVFLRQVNGKATCILGKESEFADADGNLNPERMSIDRPVFAEALQIGLKYRMLHWQTPYIFTTFVEFAQSALNTTVRSGQSEIEILLVLHQLASVATARGEKVQWQHIEAQACKSMPACKAWISALSAYVSVNAGGVEGQLLQELAHFAKTFGSGEKGPSRVLGSEFLMKLSSLNFGAGNRYPYILNACIETQLVSPPNKLVDGVCRLLLPSTLNELTKKDHKKTIVEAESLMTQARGLCKKLNLSGVSKIKAIGKLDVRLVGYICKKGKEFEGKAFGSIGEVAEAFLADVSTIVGMNISFSGATAPVVTSTALVPPDAPAPSGSPKSMQSVQQMQSKVYQAQQIGLTPAAFVIERGAGEAEVWQIKGYNGDTVELCKCEFGRRTDERVVQVDVLLDSWRLHKGVVTTLLPGYTFLDKTCSPTTNVAWKIDVAKGAVAIALRTVFGEMEPMGKDLEIFSKPVMVRANVDIKIGSLMLAPASTRIERKYTPTGICVGRYDLGSAKPEPLYICPQFTAPVNSNGQLNKSPFVCHFWQVSNAGSKQKANMVLKCLIQDVAGIQVRVPIMVNTKPVSAGDELAWEKVTVDTFSASRTMTDLTEYNAAAKKRKLLKE